MIFPCFSTSRTCDVPCFLIILIHDEEDEVYDSDGDEAESERELEDVVPVAGNLPASTEAVPPPLEWPRKSDDGDGNPRQDGFVEAWREI